MMKAKGESDAYLSIIVGANEPMKEKIREITTGNVSKPKEVYRLKGDFSPFLSVMHGVDFGDLESLPSALMAEVSQRLLAGVPTMWTGAFSGASALTAVSMISSRSTFDSGELDGDCLYIFTFAASYPVAVSFLRGEGRSVSAEAYYVPDRDFITKLENIIAETDGILTLEKLR